MGPDRYCRCWILPVHVDPDRDELPPWLGERMRRTTHDIHRAAAEAAQDTEDTAL